MLTVQAKIRRKCRSNGQVLDVVTAVSAEARSAAAQTAATGDTEADQPDKERGDDVDAGSDDVRRELHPLLFPYVLLCCGDIDRAASVTKNDVGHSNQPLSGTFETGCIFTSQEIYCTNSIQRIFRFESLALQCPRRSEILLE